MKKKRNPVFWGKRMTISQARKYAREHGVPYAPWMSTPAERKRQQKEWKKMKSQRRAEYKAYQAQQKKLRHEKVIEMPKRNPTRKQRARRKKAKKFIRALLRIPGRKNPIPALVSALGPAFETGAGSAVGATVGLEAFKSLGGKKGHTMKRKKKKAKKARRKTAAHRPKPTKKRATRKKTKKGKRNPSRPRVARFAIGVGRRAVDTARTKGEARAKANLLRRGGARRVRIKQIPRTF